MLNNFSKDRGIATLPDEVKTYDLINGRYDKNRFVLEPCDVRLLMVAE